MLKTAVLVTAVGKFAEKKQKTSVLIDEEIVAEKWLRVERVLLLGAELQPKVRIQFLVQQGLCRLINCWGHLVYQLTLVVNSVQLELVWWSLSIDSLFNFSVALGVLDQSVFI